MARLDNYVQVNERIVSATPPDLAPLHRLDVDPPQMLTESMGYIRVRLTLADGREAVGTASFDLSLSGKSAQATNPLEDCETSAVGRALAFLGYHANRSIASREEVQEAQRRAERRPPQARQNGSQRAQDRPDRRRDAEVEALLVERLERVSDADADTLNRWHVEAKGWPESAKRSIRAAIAEEAERRK